jgi:hypothetical protein
MMATGGTVKLYQAQKADTEPKTATKQVRALEYGSKKQRVT